MKKIILAFVCLSTLALATENINLSLKNFISEVMKRNSNIIYEQLGIEITSEQMNYENAITTPEFFVNQRHQQLSSPNNTESTLQRGYLSTYKENTNSYEAGIKTITNYGTQVTTSFKNSDRRSSLIEKYKDYKSEYEGSFELKVIQPLLKGFGEEATMAGYYLAQADKKIQDFQYKKRMSDVIGTGIQIYWKLYGANELYKSWENSLKIAEKNVQILEAKAHKGLIPQAEILEAKSGLEDRRAELLNMNNKIAEIKSDLLTLLNVSVEDNIDINFVLIDKPSHNAMENKTVQEYYDLALKNWPELAIAIEKLQKKELEKRLTKNQTEAKLDVVSAVWTSALDDARKDSINQELKRDFVSYYVGVEYSMPIFDDRSKSAMRMANYKKNQAQVEVESLKKTLYNNISQMFQQLKNSYSQIGYYKSGLDIKKELLDGELVKFELGYNSIRDVLKQEEDMIDYQRKLLNSIITHNMSQASLDKAVGELIKKYEKQSQTKYEEYENISQRLTQNDFTNK